MQKALEGLPPAEQADYRERLSRYEAGKPYRIA